MSLAAVIIAAVSASIAVVSFMVGQLTAWRAKRAEDVKNLLGERETVAYAALKLQRDGLPTDAHDRQLVLRALLQAAAFEGSDRARALLYRVLEQNRDAYRHEIEEAFSNLKETFSSMDKYHFLSDELDLQRGLRRVSAIERVIKAEYATPVTTSTPAQVKNA